MEHINNFLCYSSIIIHWSPSAPHNALNCTLQFLHILFNSEEDYLGSTYLIFIEMQHKLGKPMIQHVQELSFKPKQRI